MDLVLEGDINIFLYILKAYEILSPGREKGPTARSIYRENAE